MFVTIVIAALLVDGLFGLAGLIPSGPRPTRMDIFGSIQLDYKLVLNLIGTAAFVALFWITRGNSSSPHCAAHSAPQMSESGTSGV
jgi:hypothetical protein